MNPEEIKKIQALVLQHRWMNQTRFQEALGRYRSLPSPPHLLEALLKWGYLSQDQCLKIRPLLLGPPTQSTPGSPSFVLPTLRGNYQKYQILKELGRGGMGRVCLARDLDLKRLVAIKVCHRASPQDLLRFIQEAQIGSQLEHPNIGPIYDAGRTAEGNVFFAMKYIQGISLSKIIQELQKKNPSYQNQYSLRRRLSLFGKVLEGMGYVHSRGVIHRDLKPDNIMIGPFGEVLVVDWGVAKVLREGGGEGKVQKPGYDSEILHQKMEMTKAGAIVGTPGYMSPEQALGEKDQLSPPSDIYCLGVILYELLALRRPFQGAEIAKVLMAVIQGDFPPPRQISPEQKIPPALEPIVLKAMALEPLNRYQSCQEMLEDVQAYLDDQAISVYTPPLTERIARFVRKHAVLLTGVTFIFMIIALFSYFLAQAKEKQLREEKAKVQAQKKTAKTEREKVRYYREKLEAEEETRKALKQRERALEVRNEILKKQREDLKKQREDLRKLGQAYTFYWVAMDNMQGNIKISVLKKTVIPNLERALKIYPKFIEARIEFIKINLYLGRHKDILPLFFGFIGSLPKEEQKDLFKKAQETLYFSQLSRKQRKKVGLAIHLASYRPKFLSLLHWKILKTAFYSAAGLYENALNEVEELIKAPEGKGWQMYLLKAQVYKAMKKLDLAEQLIKSQLRDHPKNFFLRFMLISVFRDQHRWEEAIKLLREILQSDPEIPNGWNDLAKIMIGRFEEHSVSKPFIKAYLLGAMRYARKASSLESTAGDGNFKRALLKLERVTGKKPREIFAKAFMEKLSREVKASSREVYKKEFALFVVEIVQKKWYKTLNQLNGDAFSPHQLENLSLWMKRYLPECKVILKEFLAKNPNSIDSDWIRDVLKDWPKGS